MTNGLVQAGQGIPLTTYLQPALGVAPRFGMAYDLDGRQQIVLRGGGGLYFDRPSGNAVFAQVLNPPARQSVTLRFGQLQTLGAGGLATEAPSSLIVYEYDSPLPSSCAVERRRPDGAAVGDRAGRRRYVGQHGYNIVEGINLNAVDFGTAFLPQNPGSDAGADDAGRDLASPTDQMRAFRGYSCDHAERQPRMGHAPLAAALVQPALQRRPVVRVQRHDRPLEPAAASAARLQHNPDGTVTLPRRPGRGRRAVPDAADAPHDEGQLRVGPARSAGRPTPALRALGLVINDWQLSGIWTASTADPYTVGFNYQNGGGNVNLTGSPDYGARIRIARRSRAAAAASDLYRQFNTAAFAGPLVGSVGLESGTDYLRGCFSQVLDLSIARNIRLPGGRNIQLRADLFNAFNRAGITGRNTTLQLNDARRTPITNVQPAFDPVTGLLNNGVNLTSTGAVSAEPVAAEERRRSAWPTASRRRAAFSFRCGSHSEVGSPTAGRGAVPRSRPLRSSGMTVRRPTQVARR